MRGVTKSSIVNAVRTLFRPIWLGAHLIRAMRLPPKMNSRKAADADTGSKNDMPVGR